LWYGELMPKAKPGLRAFALILFIQLVTDVTIVLNVPIARQVMGFLYLTIIPGIVIFHILKLRDLESAEAILFTVGLSISFLMFAGLLLNELGPLIGIFEPLSFGPVLALLNGAVLLLSFFVFFRNSRIDFPGFQKVDLSFRALVLLSLPFLSIIGARMVTVSPSNNFVLDMMIVGVSITTIAATLSKKLVPPKYYPLVVGAISAALLLHFSLMSNYLYGFDIQVEYFISRLTENSSRWNSKIPYIDIAFEKTNAMLSVSILPTIYSQLLEMELPWVFKTVYPLIFSLVPVGLYIFYKEQMDRKAAFLAVFLFVSQFVFFSELLGLAKQMIAEFFFILLFLVIFNKRIKPASKSVLFMTFGAALVVSHYSISYVFLALIVLSVAFLFLFKKKGTHIAVSLIVLLFVMQFSWYIYTSNSGPFKAFSMFLDSTFSGFQTEFFNPGSRGEDVLRGTGLAGTPSYIRWVGRAFAYATEFLIILGFVSLVILKRKTRFSQEFMILASLNMAMLAACIVVPYFAGGLNMTRFYHIELFFLAPLCVVGSSFFLEFVLRVTPLRSKKIQPYLLLLMLLIPFFLFQTEFVYEVTGEDSWSIPLSKYRMTLERQRSQGVLTEGEIFATRWLTRNVDAEETNVFAGSKYFTLCGGYGMLDREIVRYFRNQTTVPSGSVVYLSWINYIFERIGVEEEDLRNLSMIYTNGDTLVYGYEA